MKSLQYFFIFLELLISFNFSVLAAENECDIVKVESLDLDTNLKRFGNGFAVKENIIVVNDHTLGSEKIKVTLKNRYGKELKNEIIVRDFHTDLAFIKLLDNKDKMDECELTSLSEEDQDFEVKGFEKEDLSLSKFKVSIKNSGSRKIKVPGVFEGIEIYGSQTESFFRKSQSGSVLMSKGKVVGILSQKTGEGTALAIPSEKIKEIFLQIEKNIFPSRRYSYDYDENKIIFQGLKLSYHPHEGNREDSSNPHEGNRQSITIPISSEDNSKEYVFVSISDLKKLEELQPNITKYLKEFELKEFFITSLDGKRILSQIDLLRELGSCDKCQIDGFLFKVEKEQVEKVRDPLIKLVGYLQVLMKDNLIKELKESNRTLDVNYINDKINFLILEIEKLSLFIFNKQFNPKEYESIKQNWIFLEKELLEFYLNDKIHDLLIEIDSILDDKLITK